MSQQEPIDLTDDGKDSSTLGKRKEREEVDEGSDEPAEKKRRGRPKTGARGSKQLKFWAFTWSLPIESSDEQTKLFIEHGHEHLSDLLKSIDPLVVFDFSLEKTQRDPEAKSAAGKWNFHYQGDCQFPGTPQRQPTLVAKTKSKLECFIYWSPASNKGISTGLVHKYSKKLLDPSWVDGVWTQEGKKKIQPPYAGQDLPKNFLRYQLAICRDLKSPVHPRAINWVFDPDGARGKSMLSKFLSFHGKGLVRWMDTGDHKDMAQHVKQWDPWPTLVVFDLPRSCTNNWTAMYKFIEQVKTGQIQTQKWDGKTFIQQQVKVWVFSNMEPENTAWSSDRLRLWKIDPNTLDFTDESKAENQAKDDAYLLRASEIEDQLVIGSGDEVHAILRDLLS